MAPVLKSITSIYDSLHRLLAQECFQVEILLILWPERVEPTCEKDGMEWLLPPPRFTPLFHLHKQSQSDPFQGNHCPHHLFESRRGKWSPTWVIWGHKKEGSCLRHVLKKDSTDTWEASKESLEPSPLSFPFSPSSVFLSLA